MKRTLLTLVAVSFCLTAPFGFASEASCTKPRLADSAILEIVKAETKKRGWVFDPKQWEYKVNRKNCGYVFFGSQVPAVPGEHFWVEITEDGKVLEYVPGA